MFRHLYLYLLLVSSISTAWASELKTSSTCADESFRLHYSFAEESRMLQLYSETGNTDARDQLINKLFQMLVSLKTEMDSCSDKRLPSSFNEAVSFLFLSYKENPILDLYEDFLAAARVPLEQRLKYSDNLYRLNWQARRYDRLPAITQSFEISSEMLDKYPIISPSESSKNKMLLSAKIDVDGSIDFSHTDLGRGELQLVILVELTCDFSKKLINELRVNPQLFEHRDNITLILPQATQVSSTEVASLAKELNNINFAFVNDESAWPKEVFFHQYPRFYFIHNNRVLEYIDGWPSVSQANLINNTFSKLKSEIKKTSN